MIRHVAKEVKANGHVLVGAICGQSGGDDDLVVSAAESDCQVCLGILQIQPLKKPKVKLDYEPAPFSGAETMLSEKQARCEALKPVAPDGAASYDQPITDGKWDR